MNLLRSLYRSVNRRLALRGNVQVGRRFVVGRGSYIRAPISLTIGDDVSIGSNCFIAVNGRIGDGTLISSQVGIVGRADHDAGAVGLPVSRTPWIYDAPVDDARHRVEIGEDVWIGFNVTIMSGIVVGRGAIIGAGTVLPKDVEPYAIMVGNPARKVGERLAPADRPRHEALIEAAKAPAP